LAKTKIVVMTALELSEKDKKSLTSKKNVVGLLEKPFDISELNKIIAGI
jgi:hypothetical protein